MARRPRLNYTAELKAEIWDQYQRGLSLNEIGRSINRHSSSIYGLLAPTGGIRPVVRRRSEHALTLAEREEVSRGPVLGLSVRTIAAGLDRAPSTISREINRNGGEVAPALVASTDFRLAETGLSRNQSTHVSHETIYRSLFIQARGVFKKEFQQHLRSQRTIRRAKQSSLKKNGLG